MNPPRGGDEWPAGPFKGLGPCPCGAIWALVGGALVGWALVGPWALVGGAIVGQALVGPLGPHGTRPLWAVS